MKNNHSIKYIARLSMFLAVGVVLNIVESLISLPFPIPGIKLGLANTIGLLVLYFYSPKEYLSIGVLRVLLVGLLRTGIGSPAFLLSLGGWFLSSIITLIFYKFIKPSIYGLSVISSLFHPTGQVFVAMIYYSQVYFINYLPILLLTSVISGLLIAFLSSRILKILSKSFS